MVPTQRQFGGLSAAVLLLLLSSSSGITPVGLLLRSEFDWLIDLGSKRSLASDRFSAEATFCSLNPQSEFGLPTF